MIRTRNLANQDLVNERDVSAAGNNNSAVKWGKHIQIISDNI